MVVLVCRVWSCFAASRPGTLAIVDGTNYVLYLKILKGNVWPSVCAL